MIKVQSKIMEDWFYEVKGKSICFYQETDGPEDDDYCDIDTYPYDEQPRIDIVTDDDTTTLYLCGEFFFSSSSDYLAGTFGTCYDIAFEISKIIHDNFNEVATINIEASFTYQYEYENPVEQRTKRKESET